MRGKVKIKEKARELRAEGKSLNEIVRRLGVSKSSASTWVRNVRLTKSQRRRIKLREIEGTKRGRETMLLKWRQYRKLHPKPQPNIDRQENRQRVDSFFDSWSNEAAYVLGYFAADGCMYHSSNGGHSTGGLYIAFSSVDCQLIETIKKVMQINNKIEVSDYKQATYKTKYLLRIVNQKAYQRLINLGFMPSKSLKIGFPKIPSSVLCHFVRGYFDGDGCVYFGRHKRCDRDDYRDILMVKFTCGSRKFLKTLQQKLNRFAGVGLGSLHPHQSAWDLAYSTRDARQLYNFMYPTGTVPHLRRKKAKFEKAFSIMDP